MREPGSLVKAFPDNVLATDQNGTDRRVRAGTAKPMSR
jgi:hypothetical protein